MKSPASVGATFVLGMVAATLVSSACTYFDECRTVAHTIEPGKYVLDGTGLRSEVGADQSYALTIVGNEVVETFTREGRVHRNLYRAAQPTVTSLRERDSGAPDAE
jgi:hypothetical protein